jgi:hypothetical protein
LHTAPAEHAYSEPGPFLIELATLDLLSSYIVIHFAKSISQPRMKLTKGPLPLVVAGAFIALAASYLAGTYGSLSQTVFFSYYGISSYLGLVPIAFTAIVVGAYSSAWVDAGWRPSQSQVKIRTKLGPFP